MAKRKIQTPDQFNGIQYNTCKNPKCDHFGVSIYDKADAYTITYGGKAMPLLKCNCCGENPPIKSNQGIHEELQRLMAHMQARPVLKCSNAACGMVCRFMPNTP